LLLAPRTPRRVVRRAPLVRVGDVAREAFEARQVQLDGDLEQADVAHGELLAIGWSGGGHGVGKRMGLKYTRAILDAIHDGSLAKAATVEDPIFGLHVPKNCANVPEEMLIAKNTWADKAAYDQKAKHLAALFTKNFGRYADRASEKIRGAGPKI
jgi:ATP-dependent phosphoenolpyruvate carboxykinase